MANYKRIIFVGQSGTIREPIAKGIMEELYLKDDVEILARGMVALFPEPLNQKAEAVLISNGITLEKFTSAPFTEDEVDEDTVIFTMEEAYRNRILESCQDVREDQIFALNSYVGDELEILNPYGGDLSVYGLCYETIRKTLIKLIIKWQEEDNG